MARANRKGGSYWRKGFSGFKSTKPTMHQFDERDLQNLSNIQYSNPEDIEQFEHFKSIIPGGTTGEKFSIGDKHVDLVGDFSHSDTKLSPEFVQRQIELAKKIRDRQDLEKNIFGPEGPTDKISVKPVKTKLPEKKQVLPIQNAKVTTDKDTKKTVVTETKNNKKVNNNKTIKVNKKTNVKVVKKKKPKNRGNRKSWAAAETYIPQSQRGKS